MRLLGWKSEGFAAWRGLAGGGGLVFLGGLAGQPAGAHVIAGVRVFPVTLSFDDPGVGDEATLPQFIWQRDAGPQDLYQLQWEFDKTITPTTAIIYNHGYDWFRQSGSKTHTGLENVFLTGKWQAYTDGAHEFVASFGVIREMSGNGQTQSIGGDAYGATSPTAYFGKGFGDLPIGVFRPLAVTGEFSYNIPDRRLNIALDNGGNPASVNGALSIQYSIPYLQLQVKDVGLPDFFGRLIPLVETSWYSPTQSPAGGSPSTWTVAPGVIYLGDNFQMGIEAMIPMNRQTGHNVGVLAQVHFFFDDLFPDSLGKPVSEWFR